MNTLKCMATTPTAKPSTPPRTPRQPPLPSPHVPRPHWLDLAGRRFQTAFVALAVVITVLFFGTPQFNTLAINFVAIVLEALPFMLLGSIVSGIVEVFISRERIASWLPARSKAAVFMAGGFGLLFPVCECAIVPVVRRLLRKGMPLDAAIAFLLAGPIVNPLVAASTAVAYSYDLSIVATRLIYGYAIAVTVGIIVQQLFSRRDALLPEIDEPVEHRHAKHHGHHHTHDDGECCEHDDHDDHTCEAVHPEEASTERRGTNRLARKFLSAGRHAADDFFDVARFLVMGAFLAACLQSFVPREIFLGTAWGGQFVTIILMMVLAVILNLCSESDAFIAASFRAAGVPLSGQLAFMILGPMLDIKLLMMYTRVFQRRAIVTIAVLTPLLVFLCMAISGVLGR